MSLLRTCRSILSFSLGLLWPATALAQTTASLQWHPPNLIHFR